MAGIISTKEKISSPCCARQGNFLLRASLGVKSTLKQMGKSLAEIVRGLDLGKSHITNPRPILFLCGGRISAGSRPPASLRGTLVALLAKREKLLFSRVILAESAATWNRSNKHFPNLVDLEEHLAELSSLILLVVESAGSIAELGAFSFTDVLRRKLFVVLEASFDNDQSFIREGPIEKLINDEGPAGSRYFAYEWLSKPRGRSICSGHAVRIARRIVKEILKPAATRTPKSEVFRKNRKAHQILLIADLIGLGGVLLISEIAELLEALNIRIEKRNLASYLYLLEKLEFIAKHRRGNIDFYAQKSIETFVKYGTSARRPFNRDQIGIEIREFQRAQSLSTYQDRKAVYGKALGGESL